MKKFLIALFSFAMVLGFAGCKKESGTIDGATDEQAEEMLGEIDAPEGEDGLDLDSFVEEANK